MSWRFLLFFTATILIYCTGCTNKPSATASAISSPSSTVWNSSILGVPWASDFNSIVANQINVKTDSRLSVKAAGNNVVDDTAALQGAIQLATSLGGGMVYLPAGNYKITTPSNATAGSPLVVPSRVILRGDSSSTSVIYVNNPTASQEADGYWTYGGIDFQGASLSGMTDLGVYSINPSTSPCFLIWNRATSPASELFFNNMDIHLNNSKSFWFESTTNLLVQNSNFDSTEISSTGGQTGPIHVVGNTNASFSNNKVTYNFGRVQMHNNINLLMQGNTLIRDAKNLDMDLGTAVESGGVELSFGQNLQILNNTIQTLNAPPGEAGDGEAIMTQQSTTQDILDFGSTTAVSSTTLTDTNALWGAVTTSRLSQFTEVVAILSGSAVGEFRTIQGINTSTKTLTLIQAWNPVPEVGSLYSVFAWTVINATIQGNTLIDNPNGIVIYDGCYNCTVQNNTLSNSRGIYFRVADILLDATSFPESRRGHHVAINNKILNNTVSNTSGLRPAYITLDIEAFDPINYNGMAMYNIQVGGNTINPYATNPSLTYSPGANEVTQEGFLPCFMYGPALTKAPLITAFQNINYWGNSQSVPVTYGTSFSPYTTQSCVTASAP